MHETQLFKRLETEHKNNNELLYFYFIILTYVHAVTHYTLTKCMPNVSIFFLSLISFCNHQCMNCLTSSDQIVVLQEVKLYEVLSLVSWAGPRFPFENDLSH